MKTLQSNIPFSYRTIKVTQSRIDKGLLAIPVSLIDALPNLKTKVYVVTAVGEKPAPKNFTPYSSSSRECRIGGMRDFYDKFRIKEGDEIVVQVLDEETLRIIPEKHFEDMIRRLEDGLDSSRDEDEADSKLQEVSGLTGSDLKEVVLNEYFRLSTAQVNERKQGVERASTRKETIPAGIKRLLTKIYEGKCQLTGFTFVMKNGNRYFEVHHIRPDIGNHVKNLLVVSPNVHAQFTYATVKESFDREGWLRHVEFNEEDFVVHHIIDSVPTKFEKEIHFES